MKPERPILRVGVRLAAATGARLFVNAAGALPADGGRTLGVTRVAGAAGVRVAVTTLGVATATAGARIAVGDKLKATAAGKVVEHDAGAIVATAYEAAAADGDEVLVHLIPN